MDFAFANHAIEKKDLEKAINLARKGSLTHLQRVWVYTGVVHLLGKGDPTRSTELLYEMEIEARRIDKADPDRVRAMIALADQWIQLDRAKAWDIAGEAVLAANAAVDFTGEDEPLRVRIETQRMVDMEEYGAPSFGLKNMFSTLAKDDLNRAVDLIKSFSKDSPRAVAVIAIASFVFEANPIRPNKR